MTLYRQTRDQSAELLRRALALMTVHAAALNPRAYAVWYEHVAGINPRLSTALEAMLRDKVVVDDAAIERLYRDHVGDPDELALRRASLELKQVLDDVSKGASDADSQAAQLVKRLDTMQGVLRPERVAELPVAVSDALAASSDMRESAVAMRRLVVASFAQIEKLNRDLNQARDASRMDGLTRLLNRAAFDAELARHVAQIEVSGDPLALVMLDIDRFKAINDSYGHVMGDRVLQAVAEALRSAVAHRPAFVARYGGEEFAVVLPGQGADDGRVLAEGCRERVQTLRIRDRRTQAVMLSVTISAGVAQWGEGEEPQALVARADAALYEAKRSGRNRVAVA